MGLWIDFTFFFKFTILTLFYFLFLFLGLHLWHVEVLRLGVKSELQLPDYTTVTATPDPSSIWDLHHNLGQWLILNPLSEARDQTCVLTDTMPGSQPAEPQQELPELYFIGIIFWLGYLWRVNNKNQAPKTPLQPPKNSKYSQVFTNLCFTRAELPPHYF